MKKSILLIPILSALCMVSFVGCKNDNMAEDSTTKIVALESKPASKKETIDQIKIPFDSKDTLNPYTLKTDLNSRIVPLIFDGLIETDINQKPQKILAETILKNGNLVTIKLKDNAYFSDGSKVTADDVVSSFKLAKGSENKYTYNLKKVVSATKITEKTVSFETENTNPCYENLFNFPIVKIVGIKALGSGRYVLSEENGDKVLIPSDNPRYKDKTYPIKKINLIKNSTKSTDGFKINMGELDFSYGMVELTKNKTMTVPYTMVPTNKLIYMGINSNSGFFSNVDARKALSEALDVTKIRVYVSLRGNDYKSGFINPQFYSSKQFEQNLISAKARLDKMGYKVEKAGKTRNGSDKKPLVLKLVVNNENEERNLMAQEIKRQLSDVGIMADIVSVPFDEYLSILKSGNFDLYLGEIGIASDMDLEPVLMPSEQSGFGTNKSSHSVIANNNYKKGLIDEKQLSTALSEDIPFFPIAYRDDLLYCKENFAPYIVATCDDIFYNILSWNLKNSD